MEEILPLLGLSAHCNKIFDVARYGRLAERKEMRNILLLLFAKNVGIHKSRPDLVLDHVDYTPDPSWNVHEKGGSTASVEIEL